MIWKRLVGLVVAAVLVIAAVVVLARLLVPDEPTFAEGFEEATESPEGPLDFMPTALGGELDVRGAREGSIILDRQLNRPSWGLGDGQASLFFDTHPLTITQMSHEGLAFFPDPEDCEFTEGQRNANGDLVAVQISCPELTDIRDNGTISLEGYVALPALMVREDIPKLGGMVTVGDQEWTVGEARLLVGGSIGDDDLGFPVGSVDSNPLSFFFRYDLVTGELSLTRIFDFEGSMDVVPGACDVGTEELAEPTPDTRIMEMTFMCEHDQVPVAVPISGTVVFELVDLNSG